MRRVHPAGVLFRTGNAFSLKPSDFGRLDWFCCDVICYPAKLWDWLLMHLHHNKHELTWLYDPRS